MEYYVIYNVVTNEVVAIVTDIRIVQHFVCLESSEFKYDYRIETIPEDILKLYK